jgi:apolipoprotein N-acyltransferase
MLKKIKQTLIKFDWKNLGLIIACGVILSLPFLRAWLGWLSFISLLPLLYYMLWLGRKKTPPRKVIKYIWLVGMVFMAITVSWMFQLNTIGLLQDPVTKLIFIPFTLGLMVLFFSVGFWVFGWLYVKLKASLDSKNSFWLIPAIWVVGEFARSILFSIGMLGEGGSVGIHWNFGAFGMAASMTPMVFGSRLVGMFGLSFLVVLANLAIFQIVRRKFIWTSAVCLALCALFSLAGYLIYSNPSSKSPTKLGIVHLGPNDHNGYSNNLIDASAKNNSKAGVIIFPEYSHLFEQQTDAQSDKKLLDQITDGPGARIITTRSVAEGNKETNAIVEIDSNNQEFSRQGKTFLIPGGEYIPYLYRGILIASGNSQLIAHHEGEYTIYQSNKPIEPLSIKGNKYGVLACSGIIAPEFYRDLVNRGADVLVNSASLSTMGMGKEFFEQAYQMARFQAVANARTMIQSARGEKSFVMDQNGSIRTQNVGQEATYMLGYFYPNTYKTPYSRLGEWVVLVSAIALLAYWLNTEKIFNKFKKHAKRKRA